MPRKSNRNDWGVLEMARDRPLAATAAAAGAAAAGLFLWSKRAQISDQLSHLSEQIGQWRNGEGQQAAGFGRSTATSSGMSEAGGGNTGRRSGGSGTTGAVSGRGRARSQPTS